MAQIASRGGGTPFGPGVVTVAELLSRNPILRQVGPGSQTVISVAALLRREGRDPRTGAFEEVDAGTALTARVHARRVTARQRMIVGGTLLAAGSVVGATVANGALSAPASDASAAGDASRTTLQAAVPLAPLTTLSQDAQTSPLDAGKPAPSSWMNVAFPDAVHKPSSKVPAAGTGKTETRAGTGVAAGSTNGSNTAGSNTAGSNTAGSTAGSTTPAGTQNPAQSSGTTATQDTGSTSPAVAAQTTGDSVTGRLGGALTGLGSHTPLAPVTGVVGGLVTGVGEFLGAVVHGGTTAQ